MRGLTHCGTILYNTEQKMAKEMKQTMNPCIRRKLRIQRAGRVVRGGGNTI